MTRSEREPDREELDDISAEWRALESSAEGERRNAEEVAQERVIEDVRAELKEALMQLNDRILTLPDTYREKSLLNNTSLALGALLSPAYSRSDKNRMQLASEYLRQALAEAASAFELLQETGRRNYGDSARKIDGGHPRGDEEAS